MFYTSPKQKQPQRRQVEKLQRRRNGRRERSRTRLYTLSPLIRPPTSVSSKKSQLLNSSVKVFLSNVSKSVVAWLVSLSVTLRMKDTSSGLCITLRSSSIVSFFFLNSNSLLVLFFWSIVLTGFLFVARATASD